MIRDLLSESGTASRDADVLVIGGGTVGLLIAARLAAGGRRVVVVESGGTHQIEDTDPRNEVDQLGSVYDGAMNGRFRCLGGTSTRWGGAMIPFQPAELDGWPLDWTELACYLPDLEGLFGLPGTPYDRPDLVARRSGVYATFVPRLAKWPPFARRNVAALLDAELRDADGPEVWLQATATGFALAPDGRLDAVTAEAANGNRLHIRAREVVIAAGAIESTRLLLLADRQAEGRLFARNDVLGRYFHDHLSVVVAAVEPACRKTINRMIGFRFESGAMRNLRFEPSADAATRAAVPSGFAHIGFAGTEGGGFDGLRELYRHLQQRRLPDGLSLLRLARSAPWLTRAAWWRWREQRLLFPEAARLELHMVIEQEARPNNRILLSNERRDTFGQPLAALDWHVDEADKARLTRITDAYFAFWADTSLASLGVLKRRQPGEAEAELARGGGIYHPGGTTRMGCGPHEGVVDSALRCFAVPNLSVAATSVFPTGGGANPTMTLMLAGLRLADRLGSR